MHLDIKSSMQFCLPDATEPGGGRDSMAVGGTEVAASPVLFFLLELSFFCGSEPPPCLLVTKDLKEKGLSLSFSLEAIFSHTFLSMP